MSNKLSQGSPRRTHKNVSGPRQPSKSGEYPEDEFVEETGGANLMSSNVDALAVQNSSILGKSPLGPPDGNKEQNKDERAFKGGLSRLLGACQNYVEAGKAFSKATSALGDELQEFSSIDWLVAQQISQHVSHIGNLMRHLAASQDKSLSTVQEALDVPVFQLLDVELQELRQLSDSRARAEDEYAHATSKQKKKGTSDKFAEENAVMEKNLDQVKAEVEAQLAILDAAKKIKVFRFLRALVTSEEEFYQLGNHGMSDLAPHLAKLDAQLAELESTQGKRCRDGYLFKLSHKVGKWKRVWAVIRNGTLEVRTDSKKEGASKARVSRKMNLLISTVRVPVAVVREGEALGEEKKFEFEIVTPERKRGWMFAAKTEAERQDWIDALQASIGSLINNQQLGALDEESRKASMKSTNSNAGGLGMAIIRKVIPGKGHRKSRSVTSADAARQMAVMLMQDGSGANVMAELAAIPGNDVCVDCGKSEPDWASMNLGVLFCLNCSGIHRHLGSHISKVRSLTMDKWPQGTLRYMKCIGNKRANDFWEARLDATVTTRLKPSSSQQERIEFITAKYEKRKFAIECSMTKLQINAAMYRAIHDMDLSALNPVPLSTDAEGAAKRRGSITGESSDPNSRVSSSSPSRQSSDVVPIPVGQVNESGIATAVAVAVTETIPVDIVWPLYKLLAWGADLYASDTESTGPARNLAQVLLEKRDPWLLHVFIVHGLEVDHVDEQTGETLLHYAARHNLFECLDVIFTSLGAAAGSACHVKNSSGESPLDLAKASGATRVLEILTAKEATQPPDKMSSSPSHELSATAPDLNLDLRRMANGSAEDTGRKSPRGTGSGALPSIGGGGADGDKPGMVKKLINRATGGHARSKSTYQGPTHARNESTAGGGVGTGAGGGPPRDPSSKIGLGKLLRKTDKRTPSLTSKSSVISNSPDSFPPELESVEDDDWSSVATPSTTPLRHTIPDVPSNSNSARTSSRHTDEVVVRAGKAPLMKGKGLDLDAIKEALQEEQKEMILEGGEEKSQPNNDEKDIMGMISSESDDDE